MPGPPFIAAAGEANEPCASRIADGGCSPGFGRTLADRSFFSAMMPLILRRLDEIPPVSLVYVLGSYVLVGTQTQQLLASSAKVLLGKLHMLPAESLARLLWVFARGRTQHTQ